MTAPHSDPRVIIQASDPKPLEHELLECHPDISVEICDSYDGLGELLNTFRPDAVFSVRFAGTLNFPREALLGPAAPAWISVGGSGVDHLGHWDVNRITVTNSAGVAADVMAEYVMMGILHFAHDVPGLECDRKNRLWPSRIVTPLRGRSILILGLGHTGQAVAALAKAFGMEVTGIRANPRATANVDFVHSVADLGQLWGKTDAVVVCVPLLDSTRRLVDERAFEAMKPGAILVDVSRGGIVCQNALLEALRSRHISGAALDVFEIEPLPPENPLWDLGNVLISPHCSSVFEGWELASIRMFSSNLKRWRHGETLFNVVDPDRGY